MITLREKGALTPRRYGLSKSIFEPITCRFCTFIAEIVVPSPWATSSVQLATDGPSTSTVIGSNRPMLGGSPRKKYVNRYTPIDAFIRCHVQCWGPIPFSGETP